MWGRYTSKSYSNPLSTCCILAAYTETGWSSVILHKLRWDGWCGGRDQAQRVSKARVSLQEKAIPSWVGGYLWRLGRGSFEKFFGAGQWWWGGGHCGIQRGNDGEFWHWQSPWADNHGKLAWDGFLVNFSLRTILSYTNLRWMGLVWFLFSVLLPHATWICEVECLCVRKYIWRSQKNPGKFWSKSQLVMKYQISLTGSHKISVQSF